MLKKGDRFLKKYLKKITKGILVSISFLLIILVIIGANFFIHLEKYPANIKREFYSSYYLYTPNSVVKKAENNKEITILVIPNNSGGTNDNIKFHAKFALFQVFLGHLIFEDLNVVILEPIFPRTDRNWRIYTHALDRDVLKTEIKKLKRLDLQLENMVDETIKRFNKKGWKVNNKFLIFGFSASGMFANRFTLLHPDRVLAASIGSPGGWPISPIKSWKGNLLRYPIGISDIDELIGRELEIEVYKNVPQLFYLGEEDKNDSVPYSDSYEHEDAELLNKLFGDNLIERWEIAEKIYKNMGANVNFELYSGIGHRPSLKSIKDTKRLFKKAINEINH